jgi:Sep-tRNA:Cys-tRNA synthetase
MSLMASFPTVVERVEHWDEEVENARYLAAQLERIEGFHQMGVRPTEHTLVAFESLPFFEVAANNKKRGYFLYHELKKRKIVGIHPGMSKSFKLNTFGLSRDQVEYAADAFIEIAQKYDIPVED